MNWYQVGNFSIFETDKKDTLVIVLPYVKDKPENPYIAYDGKSHALFFLNSEKGYVLDYINPSISKKLYDSSSVLICECGAAPGLVKKRLYPVPLKKSEKIQVILNKNGGLTHG